MNLLNRKVLQEAGFDLTAMIDVVLLLIVFFTMTAQFAESTATPMDLPQQPGESAQQKADNAVVVDVDKTGQMRVGNQETTLDGLATIVADAKARTGQSTANMEFILRVDRGCAAGVLNRIAAALARQGVRSWKLATSSGGGE